MVLFQQRFNQRFPVFAFYARLKMYTKRFVLSCSVSLLFNRLRVWILLAAVSDNSQAAGTFSQGTIYFVR